MKQIIILTDELDAFLVSKADFRNFTSMDVLKISKWFRERDYDVRVCKFSELDLSVNYQDFYFLYQTSEAPGAFYKRYVEDLVYFLEKQGAVMMPCHEYLKAHHNKVFMEFMRMRFDDDALKTIKSTCYGSWVDALTYDKGFPAVIKHAKLSGCRCIPGAQQERVQKIYRKSRTYHNCLRTERSGNNLLQKPC